MKLRTPIRASEPGKPLITFKGPWSAEDRACLHTVISATQPSSHQSFAGSAWTFIVLEETQRPVYVATCTTPALETFSARSLGDLLVQIRLRIN